MAGRQEQGSKTNPIQVQKFLKGIDYPADHDTLCKTAEKNGADDNVLETLRRLPDHDYNSPNDVSEEIGKME